MKTNPMMTEITILTSAKKNSEAVKIAEEAFQQVIRDEPDNIRWLSRVETLNAMALWQFGAIEQSSDFAQRAWQHSQQIGSIRNETSIEKLYQRMLASKYRKEPSIRVLGEALANA